MHEKLGIFIGSWVTAGQEEQCIEKCEWFEGGKHVVCSWSTESDGNKTSGKSILGYSALLGKFTYYGFNSLGRNSYQTGDYTDKKFTFIGEMKYEDKIVKSRTTLTFSDNEKSAGFQVEIENNGGWKTIGKEVLNKVE